MDVPIGGVCEILYGEGRVVGEWEMEEEEDEEEEEEQRGVPGAEGLDVDVEVAAPEAPQAEAGTSNAGMNSDGHGETGLHVGKDERRPGDGINGLVPVPAVTPTPTPALEPEKPAGINTIRATAIGTASPIGS